MGVGRAALVGLDRGHGLVDPAAPVGRGDRIMLAKGKRLHLTNLS
jgi:hypothetical protein